MRVALAAGLAWLSSPLGACGADACEHRGELDAMCCDDDNDRVADSPGDSRNWKNPPGTFYT
jgi:phosphonate transport system substrate-binding protein